MPSLYSRLSGNPSSSHQPLAPSYSSQAQDDELDAAFSDPTTTTGSDEHDRLVSSSHPLSDDDDDDDDDHHAGGSAAGGRIPGGYDFDRDPAQEPSRSLRDRLMPSRYSRLPTQIAPPSHLPLPPRGPPAAPYSPNPPTTGRTVGGGTGNDGVFANLSAKPSARPGADGAPEYVGGDDDGGPGKDEVLPSYDSAALDTSPPYWETTVTLPGGTYGVLGPDDVLVEGLPVGNLFGFAWNLLVSMSFQFVGFLLTYLLHTSHAAKNGSRAGLGVTLIQYGLYLRTRSAELATMTPEQYANATISTGIPSDDPSDPWGLFGTPNQGDWDGSTPASQVGGQLAGNGTVYDGVLTAEQLHMSSVANEWLSYVLMVMGWFLVLGGGLNYWRAVRWARAVRGEVEAGGTTA